MVCLTLDKGLQTGPGQQLGGGRPGHGVCSGQILTDPSSMTRQAARAPAFDRTIDHTLSLDASSARPRILTFTSLFPNVEQPLHGLFVRERIRALAKVSSIRVVAPVPWAPPLPYLPRRYAGYRRVVRQAHDGPTIVDHPRFFVVPKLLKSTDGVLMGLSCLPAVTKIRESFPFDLIDAHWAYPDGVAAAVLARHFGVPFAVTVRGDDVNVFAQERGRGAAIRWALRRAALVIALSEDLKARVQLITGGNPRIVVVPNGVDGDRFRLIDPRAARRCLGLEPSARILITVGRLHVSKGIPHIIEALGRLPDGFADVRLIIVGAHDREADARPAIAASISRHRLQGRVHLVGPQTPDQLVDWYNAANVFCSATTREGSPNVLLEAMACGLPCVTTPVGGNPEVICSSDVGQLVAPEPAGLASAIAAALTRPWNRERIAMHASRRTWATVADECRRQLVELVPATA